MATKAGPGGLFSACGVRKHIGYLVVDLKTERTDNIGGDLIKAILADNGYSVEDCGPSDINRYNLVIHSIPSTYQLIDLLRAARKHRFDKRQVKILIGGFGVQNITAVKPYIDYAYYGRAHDDIINVVGAILANGDIDNPYVYCVDRNNNVTLNQAPLCTQHFREEFVGCVNKCKFCHYTWSRKPQGNPSGYVQTLLTGRASPELLWQDILKLRAKPGRIRTAIDGFSERLRYTYGKRISNDDIVDGINRMGSLKESKFLGQYNLWGEMQNVGKKECVTCLAYNIGHMPNEGPEDWEELRQTVHRAQPKERVILIIHITPFRPSLLTPMQWEPVKLWPEWSSMREKVLRDDPKMLCKYSYTLEGAFSHLCSVVIDRLKDPEDTVLDGVLRPKGDTSAEKARYLLDQYLADRFCKQLPIDDPPPVPYLEGYIPNSKIRSIAKIMRRKSNSMIA